MRLRSPPEKPSFRWRSAKARVDAESVHPLGQVQAHLKHAQLLESLARGDRLAQELDDRHPADRFGVLEREKDPGPRARVGTPGGDVLAQEQDLATRHPVAWIAHDDARERGLAGAVRAHERVDLALVDEEVDAAQDHRTFGLGVEIAQLEQWLWHEVSLLVPLVWTTVDHQPRSTHSSRCGRSTPIDEGAP